MEAASRGKGQCSSPATSCHFHCSRPAFLLVYSFISLFKLISWNSGSLAHLEDGPGAGWCSLAVRWCQSWLFCVPARWQGHHHQGYFSSRCCQQAPGNKGSGRKSQSTSGSRKHPSAWLGRSCPEMEAPFSLGLCSLDPTLLGRSCILAI